MTYVLKPNPNKDPDLSARYALAADYVRMLINGQTPHEALDAIRRKRRAAANAEEAKKRAAAAEAEAKKRAAEEAEAKKRAAEEAEAKKRAAEEEEAKKRAAEEAEAKKRAAEEAEAKKRAAEEAEAKKRAAEAAEAEAATLMASLKASKRSVRDKIAALKGANKAEIERILRESAPRQHYRAVFSTLPLPSPDQEAYEKGVGYFSPDIQTKYASWIESDDPLDQARLEAIVFATHAPKDSQERRKALAFAQ